MTTTDRSGPTLAEVMELHPQLNNYGLGAFEPNRKTSEQRAAEVAEGRAILMSNEPLIKQLVEWLTENVAAIKTPSQDSYSVKGLIERSRGEYITNGDLIAAALIVGYPFKYDASNVIFGMSKADLDKVRGTP